MHLQNVRVPVNHSRPQDVISHTHQRAPYQFTSFAFSQTLVFKLYQMQQEALLLANRVGQKVFNPSFGRLFGGGFDVDVLCVHSAFPLVWWLIHLSVSSLAAKGKGATAGRKEKGADKSFCGPWQKVLAAFILPFG